MRRARTAHRNEVLNRTSGIVAADKAVDGKAERGQRGLKHVKHRAAGGGNAGNGDERLGESDGIDHAARPSKPLGAFLRCRKFPEGKLTRLTM